MSSPSPGAARTHLVGILGGKRVGAVDARGTLAPERALWTLAWWIGADDRWHLAGQEAEARRGGQIPVQMLLGAFDGASGFGFGGGDDALVARFGRGAYFGIR